MAANALSGTGTYALIIALDRPRTIDIGRRGRICFPAGFYFYAGSALGPGGLAGRLKRHLRADKRLHWHIDYLLGDKHARVIQVWFTGGSTRRECDWARAAMRLPGAHIVAPRLGASDCCCLTHLIAFDALPERERFAVLTRDRVRLWPTWND